MNWDWKINPEGSVTAQREGWEFLFASALHSLLCRITHISQINLCFIRGIRSSERRVENKALRVQDFKDFLALAVGKLPSPHSSQPITMFSG